MSLDALVWLLVGVGLGVGGSLLLLMAYSGLERFRLGQRIRRARLLRDKAMPRAVSERQREEDFLAAAIADIRAAESGPAPVEPVPEPVKDKAGQPVDAKTLVVAQPRPRALPAATRSKPREATPTTVVEAAGPPAPVAKPVPRGTERPVVKRPEIAKASVQETAPSTIPRKPADVAAAPPTSAKPVAPPVGEARPAPGPVAANDGAARPKLTVVASTSKPAIKKAVRFVAPDDKPAVAEPSHEPEQASRPTEVEKPAAEVPPAAKDEQAPRPTVKALFGEAFTIEKLTVPGALPQPDEGAPKK